MNLPQFGSSILELPWTSGDPNFDRKSAQKKAKIGSPVYFFIFFSTLYFFFDVVFFSRAFKSPFSDVIFLESKTDEKCENGGPKMHKNRSKKGGLLDRLYFFGGSKLGPK